MQVVWKDGVLVIKNEPFADVIHKLERWFGVEIENQCLQSSSLLFSGVFERSELEIVLQVICANLNINYIIDGKRVILKD
jgi:transmembrane sensor